MLAPGRLPSGVVTAPTSQMDVAPTVLGLLGLPWEAPFFGQDVLALGGRPHPILLSHDHDVALMERDELAVLGLGRAATTLVYDRSTRSFAARPPDPALIDLATAYYQTAYGAFVQHRS